MRITIPACLFLSATTIGAVAANAADKTDAVKNLETARSLFDKAVQSQGGWQSTKKLISTAELAAAKGDKKQAKILADRAAHEARLSLEQAKHENDNWSEPEYLIGSGH